METKTSKSSDLNKDFEKNLEQNAQCTKRANIDMSIKTASLRNLISILKNERENIYKNFIILCMTCNQDSKINEWDFVQKTHYIAPHGCSGGDYSVDGETDICDIVCPICKSKNYIYNHPQKDQILRIIGSNPEDIFKSVIKE